MGTSGPFCEFGKLLCTVGSLLQRALPKKTRGVDGYIWAFSVNLENYYVL